MTTTLLYAVPVSNFAASIRLCLHLKRVPFEERLPPGGYGSQAYKAIVPTGTVPALVDGDVVLTESTVIAEYLDERHPQPRLLPATGAAARARVRLLQRLHDSRIEPPLRALFAHVAPAMRDPAAVEQHWRLFGERLHGLAALTKPAPFLAGSGFSLADLPYPATLLLAERMATVLEQQFELPAPLAAWWKALCNHDAVAPVLADYATAVEDWLASKQAP
ncbi:MAG: glutathione S-transferase family protein [Pseudomonadota bacterium]